MLQMALADQLIQILQADLILYQQNDVARVHTSAHAVAHSAGNALNVLYSLRSLFFQHGNKLLHHPRDHRRIIRCPVMPELRQAKPA